MRALANKDQVDSIAPAVHLEFIQNHAAHSENDGIAEIESYHRSLFLHHHARDLERFQQQARIHEDQLARLETRLNDTHARLGSLEKTHPGHGEWRTGRAADFTMERVGPNNVYRRIGRDCLPADFRRAQHFF